MPCIRVLVVQKCNPLGIFFKVVLGPSSTENTIRTQQVTPIRYLQSSQQNDIRI